MHCVVVVGNPKPRSRTRRVAETVAQRVVDATGTTVGPTIDLCEHADALFRWPADTMAELNTRAAAAAIVVVASPTYKAAYSGMLKAFLDRYPHQALSGVIAIPVMTGAGMQHAMAVDTALRPVLIELGASVPTQGLFFEMSNMDRVDEVVDEWARVNLASAPQIGIQPRKVNA